MPIAYLVAGLVLLAAATFESSGVVVREEQGRTNEAASPPPPPLPPLWTGLGSRVIRGVSGGEWQAADVGGRQAGHSPRPPPQSSSSGSSSSIRNTSSIDSDQTNFRNDTITAPNTAHDESHCLVDIHPLLLAPSYLAGAKYYGCGDTVIKLTSAYLADSPSPEPAASVALTVAALVSLGIATLLRTTAAGPSGADRARCAVVDGGGGNLDAAPSAVGAANPSAADINSSSRDDLLGLEGDDDDGEEGEKKGDDSDDHEQADYNIGAATDSPPMATVAQKLAQKLAAVVVWIASITLLSGPSFIYSMTSSVPTGDDSVFRHFVGPAAPGLLLVITRVAPVLLTLINATLIPTVVRWCSEKSGWPSAWLLLTSRLMTTWLLPAAAVIMFSNSCGKGWLGLWSKCQSWSGGPRQLDVVGPAGSTADVQGRYCIHNGRKYVWGYIEAEVLLSGTTAICNLPSTTNTPPLTPDASSSSTAGHTATLTVTMSNLANAVARSSKRSPRSSSTRWPSPSFFCRRSRSCGGDWRQMECGRSSRARFDESGRGVADRPPRRRPQRLSRRRTRIHRKGRLSPDRRWRQTLARRRNWPWTTSWPSISPGSSWPSFLGAIFRFCRRSRQPRCS